MIRIRIGNEMIVHCAVMVALSLSCHSEGVGPETVRSCSQLREHGVQVCGDRRMCGYLTGRGVGGMDSNSPVIPSTPPRSDTR